ARGYDRPRRTIPENRLNSSRFFFGMRLPTTFQNRAIGMVRLSRRPSSKEARYSSSFQPNGAKKAVFSAGPKRNGALPAATTLPQLLAIILSNAGLARS